MKEIYLDNAATTCCLPDAAKKAYDVMTQDFGNPSSLHMKGVEAEKYLDEARHVISKSLRCKEKEIIFTSGGSESNNTAIIGGALRNQRNGKHIITTAIEHEAVLSPIRSLEKRGFSVTYLPVSEEGIVLLDELSNALSSDTVLVSIMHVNNETGAVQPVEEAARLIHSKNKKTIFHVDAIQSFAKLPIDLRDTEIDMLSVSGHKLHAPKGSGFLFVRDKVLLDPLIYGGGQEGGLRSGTQNVPAIAGLCESVRFMTGDIKEHLKHFRELRERLLSGLSDLDGISVNGPFNPEKQAPYIVSLSVKDVRAEVLLHALEEKGIFVGAGSACSSNRPHVSGTLQAMGLEKDLLDKTIRLSFSVFTTDEEIDETVAAMKELVPVLSRYRRG